MDARGDKSRPTAPSHDFVRMDLDLKEAMEVEPAKFVLKATWDIRRPRLVLQDTLATGTLFDDFDKISAMLEDDEACALLLRAGVETSKCWVAVTWVPAASGSASSVAALPFDHFGESIMRVWPEFRVMELRAQDRTEVTLKAVSKKCMEVLEEEKEDAVKETYTSATAANIGNLDAWLAEQGFDAEEAMDLSGVYSSGGDEDVVLSQIGDAGEIANSSNVWAYTIDGSTVTFDDSDGQGTVTGSKGKCSISWSDGYMYRQLTGPSTVVKVTPQFVGGKALNALNAPNTCTAGLLLRQIALDSGDRWQDLRLEYKGESLQLDYRLVDLGISGDAAINVVREKQG